MVEAALQMAVMAVLSVRSDGEYRNATAAETTSLIENTYVAHHPRPVAVRFDLGGCFVSREWNEALSRLDIFADPTAGHSHLSSLGRGKDNPNTGMVCWEIARDPSFTLCRTSCVTGHEHKQ